MGHIRIITQKIWQQLSLVKSFPIIMLTFTNSFDDYKNSSRWFFLTSYSKHGKKTPEPQSSKVIDIHSMELSNKFNKFELILSLCENIYFLVFYMPHTTLDIAYIKHVQYHYIPILMIFKRIKCIHVP